VLPATGWDIVIRADRSAAACEFQELVDGLASTVQMVASPQ
jgi:RNase P protein component